MAKKKAALDTVASPRETAAIRSALGLLDELHVSGKLGETEQVEALQARCAQLKIGVVELPG